MALYVDIFFLYFGVSFREYLGKKYITRLHRIFEAVVSTWTLFVLEYIVNHPYYFAIDIDNNTETSKRSISKMDFLIGQTLLGLITVMLFS